MKTASKCNRKNPTNANALKLKKAQNELANIYLKEYIQNQIDKIRDSVEDRQSRIALQTINKVSRRKSTAKAKLKATNHQERIKLWKQHFENLLISPEVWKTRQCDDILLRHCNAIYNQNPIDRWMKGCILPFPKKGDFGLAQNYRTYIHSSQNIQCPTTQLHRTQNWQHSREEPKWLPEK